MAMVLVLGLNPGLTTQRAWADEGDLAPASLTAQADTTVTIGTGTYTQSDFAGHQGDTGPAAFYCETGMGEQIYAASEIEKSGSVTSIAFEASTAASKTKTIKVYMGTTSLSSFSSASDLLGSGSLTEVYSGSRAMAPSAGWDTIELATPYAYDCASGKNLVVAVTGYGAYFSNPYKMSITKTSYDGYGDNLKTTWVKGHDSSQESSWLDIDQAIAATTTDTNASTAYRPNIQLTFATAGTSYTVNKGAEANGTFSINKTSAAKGETVTVTTTPAANYKVGSVTYTPEDGDATPASGSGNTYTFEMPDKDVTVNVEFVEKTGDEALPDTWASTKDANMVQISTQADMDAFVAGINDGSFKATAKTIELLGDNLKVTTPIGTTSNPFISSGGFDGKGHTVELNIAATNDNAGMFGVVGNVVISNLVVTGTVAGGTNQNIGGVIGKVNAKATVTLTCVGNEATVTATGYSNAANVGGLVGLLAEDDDYYGKPATVVISKCYNRGSVTGSSSSSQYVGGLIGAIYNDGYDTQTTISASYNSGTVNGTRAGGFVGGSREGYAFSAPVKISGCYNAGSVTGSETDAFVGWLSAQTPEIESSYYDSTKATTTYSTGTTEKNTAELKALAATLGNLFKVDAGNINNGYPVLEWEKSDDESETATPAVPTVSLAATKGVTDGKATEGENVTLTATPGWVDAEAAENTKGTIEYTWYACADAEGANPTKIENATAATYTFTASETAYYQVGVVNRLDNGAKSDEAKSDVLTITVESASIDKVSIGTKAELAAFATAVNGGEDYDGKIVELTADIDLDNEAWTPIGSYKDGDAKPFKGTFDGNGKTISNMNVTSGSYSGLFGYVDGATIRNVIVQGTVKNAGGDNAASGGIIARARGNVTIEKVGSEVAFSASYQAAYIGGVIGRYVGSDSTLTITNSYHKGDTTMDWGVSGGASYSGGIIGSAVVKTLTITSCYNTGTVGMNANKKLGNYVGGIIGYASIKTEDGGTSSIANCVNAGGVFGPDRYSGAICGFSFDAPTGDDSNYYLANSCAVANGGTLTETADFATLYSALNAGNYKTMWIDGSAINTATKCPALAWEEAASTLESHSITVTADVGQGTVEVSGATYDAQAKTAQENDTITLTVSAKEGYEFSDLTVKQGTTDVEVTDKGNGVYEFPMPAGDVTVTATFNAKAAVLNLVLSPETAAGTYSLEAGKGKTLNVGISTITKNGSDAGVDDVSAPNSMKFEWFKDDATEPFKTDTDFANGQFGIKKGQMSHSGQVSTTVDDAGKTVKITLKATWECDGATKVETLEWTFNVVAPAYAITPVSTSADGGMYEVTGGTYRVQGRLSGTGSLMDITSAAEGDQVTIVVSPDTEGGYIVDAVKYNDGTDHTLTPDTYGYVSFTMPAKAVTVTVAFKEASSQSDPTLGLVLNSDTYTYAKDASGNAIKTIDTGTDSASWTLGVDLSATMPGGAAVTSSDVTGKMKVQWFQKGEGSDTQVGSDDTKVWNDNANSDGGALMKLHSYTAPFSKNTEAGTYTYYAKVTWTVNGTEYTATSPDFVATVANTYNVAVGSGITNGSVAVSATKAAAGTEIAVTPSPANGYELDALTVTDEDNGAVAVADNKFTMPAKSVTVSATFKATAPTGDTFKVTDDPAIITTQNDWDNFVTAVNNGTTFEGKTVQLAGDVTAAKMVGTVALNGSYVSPSAEATKVFKGSFDGGKHTIAVNVTADVDSAGVGLFAGVYGDSTTRAEIKNLKVTGSVTVPAGKAVLYTGGVVGVGEYLNITDVSSDVAVTDNGNQKNGNGAAGGILGAVAGAFMNYSKEEVDTTSIIGCASRGSVTSAGNYVGGIVGSLQYWNAYIGSSYSVGTLSASSQSAGRIAGRTNNELTSTFDACYGVGSQNPVGTETAVATKTNCAFVTAENVASLDLSNLNANVQKSANDATKAEAFVADPSDEPINGGKPVLQWEVGEAATFTVTFANTGDSTIDAKVVAGGAKVDKPADPTWEGHAFKSWQLDGKDYDFTTPVTGDITLTATWTDLYTVTFVDEDGTTVLKAATEYASGTKADDIAQPEKTPTKEATAEYTYTFDGWDPALADVTANATYKATYKAEKRQYTITFKNDDGKELSAEKYEYGTAAADIKAPANPTKAADSKYIYEFVGWTPALAQVTGDAAYTAIFKSETPASAKTEVTATGDIFAKDLAAGDSIELIVEDVTAEDKDDLASKYSARIGDNAVAGVYEVDLKKRLANGSEEAVDTENVGNLTLTFPVEGAADGANVKVIQLHEVAGKAEPQVFEYSAKAANEAVTITLNGKLSKFIVTVQADDSKGDPKDDPKDDSGDGSKSDGADTDKQGDGTDSDKPSGQDGADADKQDDGSGQDGTSTDQGGTSQDGADSGKSTDQGNSDSKSGSAADTASSGSSAASESKVMYRLYNAFSGEHLYTSDKAEAEGLVAVGWTDEGKGWTAPEKSNTPVYRLYNPFEPLGDHHYTVDKAEYDELVAAGWVGEDVGWYSDDEKGVPLFRAYNPNAYSMGMTGAHHYTADKGEADSLVAVGWIYEDIAWYGVK